MRQLRKLLCLELESHHDELMKSLSSFPEMCKEIYHRTFSLIKLYKKFSYYVLSIIFIRFVISYVLEMYPQGKHKKFLNYYYISDLYYVWL